MEKRRAIKRGDRGSALVYGLVLIITGSAVAALAVDLAYLLELKGEIQNVADSAALAAASGLPLGAEEARRRAIDFAQRNPILGRYKVALDEEEDITLGTWDSALRVLTPTEVNPDVARVSVQWKVGEGAGASPFFFAPLLGLSAVTLEAQGTAGKKNTALESTGPVDYVFVIPVDTNTLTNHYKVALDVSLNALSIFIDSILQGTHAQSISQFGFVTFTDQEGTILSNPMTFDYIAIKEALNLIRGRRPPPDRAVAPNSVTDGLRVARQELLSVRARPGIPKRIVLIGGTNIDERDSLIAIAQTIRKDGFTLFPVTFGIANWDPVLYGGPDPWVMMMDDVAKAAGGENFVFSRYGEIVPDDAQKLAELFRTMHEIGDGVVQEREHLHLVE